MKRRFKKESRRHVALLVETSRSYGRELLMGIAKYVRIHGSWSIDFQEGDPGEELPEWFARRKWDGIIARVKTPSVARAVSKPGAPVVDLYGGLPGLAFHCIRSDDALVGQMAAEHLIDHGFRYFAFCGFNGTDWSDSRRDGFARRLAEAGFACQVFENPRLRRAAPKLEYEEHGVRFEQELKRWLKSLPKPMGLMACSDARGRQVLTCCRDLKVAVPDEVAVIGVDKDEVFCELSDIPLSSVILNAPQIGYEAAALLDRLMAGARPVDRLILVKPRGVAARLSTDVLAIEDTQVVKSLRLIRDRACEGLDVGALLKAVPVSRSVLERRFARIVGHAPKEEILRVRLQRVCQLLADSDIKVTEVAFKAGFENSEYMYRFFKKRLGMTPVEFRDLARLSGKSLSSLLARIRAPQVRESI